MILTVKINPNSQSSGITTILSDGTIKLNIKSPPEKGKANTEIIKLLAKHYNIDSEKIKILSGKTSKLKKIKILI